MGPPSARPRPGRGRRVEEIALDWERFVIPPKPVEIVVVDWDRPSTGPRDQMAFASASAWMVELRSLVSQPVERVDGNEGVQDHDRPSRPQRSSYSRSVSAG
jgi:hypothetical protein